MGFLFFPAPMRPGGSHLQCHGGTVVGTRAGPGYPGSTLLVKGKIDPATCGFACGPSLLEWGRIRQNYVTDIACKLCYVTKMYCICRRPVRG